MHVRCAVILALWASVAAAQPAPLVVATAVPDPASRTLTITGARFGARPFVTLNLVPLTLQFASDSHVVVTVPIDMMPSGTYLLTVSRGGSPGESASLDVQLGRGPASDPAGAPAGRAGGRSGEPPVGFGSPGDPAARVGDRVITLADVDREWWRADPGSYIGVARRIDEMRRRAVDRMVADELLAREAAARGVTVDALIAEEIPKRVVTMPDSAAVALYQSLGDTTRGASLDQMRPALRAWLARFSEPEIARMQYVEELMRVSTRAEVLIAAPRIEVERSPRDPSLGPAGAPIEIVTFGDLRNGRYAAFAQAFPRVRETFGERVRIVFKHLPADDPDSLAAAAAAQCAHAQGRFWAVHDALLAIAGPVGPARLAALAGELKLDREPFEACLDRGARPADLQAALDEARQYDIHSSPSFLVNGRLAPDPPPFLPPFEFFTRLIEEELLRLSTSR
jgi:protein-disulfide isomerase